jgi:hypothetical protein
MQLFRWPLPLLNKRRGPRCSAAERQVWPKASLGAQAIDRAGRA